MSGIDDSGTSDEVPEEYAAVYRDAYLRALAEDQPLEQAPAPVGYADGMPPLAPASDTLRRLRVPLLIAVAVLALAGVGIWLMLNTGDDPSPAGRSLPVTHPSRIAPSTTPRERPSTSATTAPTTSAGWNGPVVAVTPVGIAASCTSKPGVDSAGDPVRYIAANALDGDPTTAWRCDGAATGVVLTITLPANTQVGEVGLIPGYAKTDPASGVDRYAENNRITRVRWTLANGVVIDQDLDAGPTNRAVQTIRVPRTATGSITLEVLAVERGARNTTAISEVEVQAAG